MHFQSILGFLFKCIEYFVVLLTKHALDNLDIAPSFENTYNSTSIILNLTYFHLTSNATSTSRNGHMAHFFEQLMQHLGVVVLASPQIWGLCAHTSNLPRLSQGCGSTSWATTCQHLGRIKC